MTIINLFTYINRTNRPQPLHFTSQQQIISMISQFYGMSDITPYQQDLISQIFKQKYDILIGTLSRILKLDFFYYCNSTMQKDGPEEQVWGEVELNQNGRPKQHVIFYHLTEEMKQQAYEQLSKDQTIVTEQDYEKMTNCGQKVWDKFYQFHKCSFFKDRTYLERQMPEITFFKQYHKQHGKISNYYQLGCGVGNTLFPLLRQFQCFNYYGCDISAKAISLIEQEMEKHEDLKPRMHVKVCDLVVHDIPYQQVGDLNSLIFVLSAIAPEKHAFVMQKVADSMKPGSFLFFRDYGRYDFGQLNLSSKGNRKLKDNFYRKNDGVCVYYFEEQELKSLCEKAGLKTIRVHLCCKLLQNRKTGLKMYRVWIQGRFYKPPLEPFLDEKLKQQLAQQQKQEKEMEQLQKAEVVQQLQKKQNEPEKVKRKEQSPEAARYEEEQPES